MSRPRRTERGTTGPQIMLLLVAPAIGASVLAAAVIGTGRSGSDHFRQIANAGLRDVTSGLQLNGPFYARTDGYVVTELLLQLTTLPGGSPVDMGPETGPLASYVSGSHVTNSLPYDVEWIRGDGDSLLEDGELVRVTVHVADEAASGEGFVVELRPPGGLAATAKLPPRQGQLDTVLSFY